jgi:putative flavoprotein involved in K+ transport
MNGDRSPERFDTVIVGGGQAGLAAGYNLARLGQSFVILDGHQRIGDTWRERWDSLRVFTPAKYNGLPGMRFPSPRLSFPTKDEVADYLDTYAARFELPVITGVRVDRITKNSAGFVLSADHRTFEASNVVVATGACHNPKVPAFAAELDPKITQIHSSVYKSPAQLKEGAVLVVGLGNSGAEISFELARTHRTFVSGRPTGEIPAPHGPGAAIFLLPLIKFMGSHVLNMDTPIGRKVEPQFIRHGAPLIRRKLKDLASAGIERLPRVVGVRNGLPELADGRVLEVANVIWCTGFSTEFGWIDLPVFAENGRPIQYRGVVASMPGLYFIGLEFLYAATSAVLPGVGRDAGYIAKHIAKRVRPGMTAPSGAEEIPIASVS